MAKAIISILILAASIIGAVLLFGMVLNEYPTFGTFENLFYLGLVAFGLAVGIFVSALLLESLIRSKS